MDFLAKQAFKSATGGAFSKHKDRKKVRSRPRNCVRPARFEEDAWQMSEDERKVAELTANKVDMKQRKKDRKAMESDARAELEAATRQAEAKKALEDKANAEKMASLEERRRSTVVKHHEKSEDLFSVTTYTITTPTIPRIRPARALPLSLDSFQTCKAYRQPKASSKRSPSMI